MSKQDCVWDMPHFAEGTEPVPLEIMSIEDVEQWLDDHPIYRQWADMEYESAVQEIMSALEVTREQAEQAYGMAILAILY